MVPMTKPTPRHVTLRIGLPDERGPRVRGFIPGTRVRVADPKTGPSGVHVEIEPIEPTDAGERWVVRWKDPRVSPDVSFRYFRTLPEARALARALRGG